MRVGYARVSTVGQSLDVQVQKLSSAGCEKIYQEKASGGSRDGRPELMGALEFVRDGDVLLVSRLDRLARSVADLAWISGHLEKKHVDLVVIDQAIDTTTATGKLMFHVLSAIAEFERALIRDRAAEGRAKAQQKGVRFGAPNKLSQQQLLQMQDDFQNGDIAKSAIASKYGVSRATVYRLCSRDDVA